MKLDRRHFLQIASASAGNLAVSRFALADNYPTRPVRMIVPFAPGGVPDVVGRIIAPKLAAKLGQQFYIENIGGAGGNIGIGRAAQANRDGYTILFTSPALVTNPALFERVPFNPQKDFAPVTVACTSPLVLAVNPSLPVASVKELVGLIKANPGKYNYASPGVGTLPHLVGESFRLSLGLDLVHIPYNSGGQVIGATVAGHTPIAFAAVGSAEPHVAEGKLRALAVGSRQRSQALPNVPTMTEAGYPEIQGEIWSAALVPAGTPGSIITLLHREIVSACASPDVRERLATLGHEPVGNTPAEFAAQINAELAKWTKVVRDGGIKIFPS